MRYRWMKVSLGCALISAIAAVALLWTAPAAAAGGDRCTDPPAGLTAWWPGEGSAVDLVGDWHGTLVGDTSFAAGEVGDAFTFDGSGDYVEVADASAGDLGADPFTVAFWMTSQTAGSGAYLVGKSHPDGGAEHGWDIRLDAGRIQVVGVNGWDINITSDELIAIDQWHHVAVASEGATVTLYIDGAGAGTCARQTISTAPNFLRFGFTTNFGGSAFQGQLDEIQLFDRALSAGEIEVLRQSAPGGSCRPCAAMPAGAVAWWRAEDNFDDSVGRLNGRPTGGISFDGGLVGRTFGLDGTDDFVALPRDAVWDFGTASISVTAWFQSSSAGYRNILRYHNGYGGAGFWGLRTNPSGKLEFLLRDQNGSTSATLTSDAVYTDGAWHHVTAVRDAGAGLLRLYVDGAEAATPAADLGLNVAAPSDTVPAIGAGVWGSGGAYEPFAGSIDEVAIFDRALSADEAARIFIAGERGICHDCVEQANDLVSWWRGDGNAFDSVGGNDGALENGAAFATGLVGQAISLPTGNDFVEVPHDDSLSFGATDPMSIAFWAYRATDDAVQHLLSKRHDCYATPWNYQFYRDSNQDKLCFGSSSGDVCTTADKLPLAEWTHLAVTFDGSAGTFYVNGLPEATAAIALGPDTNSPPLRFGSVADCDTLDLGLRGRLDEIEIYDRALSRDEVLGVFRSGSFGRCTDCAPVPGGLAAWWRAEGDATDAAGSNDGTGMNGAGYGVGRVGRAFDLEDDAEPDYVEVPHSASLDITGPLSVEGWVFLDNQTLSTVVGKGDYYGTESITSYSLEIGGSSADGKPTTVLYGSYAAGDLRISDDVLGTGRWYHLAMTWDGSTTIEDNHRLYIDGAVAETWTKTTGLNSTNESLTIGAMKPPDYYRVTDGRIDELSIYSSELTAAEIRTIVAAGAAGKCVAGDSEPDVFTFVDSIGHGTSTIVGTDPVTVAGIDRPAAVGISGCTAPFCWYAVNDGGWTTQNGEVEDGDVVYVRQMTSATGATTTDLTLAIGGVSDTFSATTIGSWNLTVTLAGPGSGTVTSAPEGIDCGGDCSELFDAGTVVTLAATPDPGSVFAGFSGDADCADGELTVVGDVQCTATFEADEIFSDDFESGDTGAWSAAVGGV